MGWPYPTGHNGPMDLPIILFIVWIPLGIIPSIFLSIALFGPEKSGLMIPFIIYLLGIGLIFLLYIIIDKTESSSNKFARWFCGFD